jgi:hypothetical protein
LAIIVSKVRKEKSLKTCPELSLAGVGRVIATAAMQGASKKHLDANYGFLVYLTFISREPLHDSQAITLGFY